MHTILISDHHFYIGSPQAPHAWLEFTLHTTVLTLIHTEVTPILQGQGVGAQLVAFAVDYARRNGYQIVPLCHYAATQFEKKAEFRDVLMNP